MRISQQISAHDDRIVLLHFEGDLNASDCESTSKIFQEIIDSKKYFIIALMENVTFVSSPFLGELMGCKLRLTEQGGNMVIVGLNYDLRERLIQMGADKIFQFYPDTHTAYNHYHWEYTQTAQVVTITLPPKLQAVPANSQASDRCGTLTIDSTGKKTHSAGDDDYCAWGVAP